jgi:hypothetical protein
LEQTNKNLYVSRKTYEEIRQALADRGFTYGVDGYLGDHRCRFLGVFMSSPTPAAARRENRQLQGKEQLKSREAKQQRNAERYQQGGGCVRASELEVVPPAR